MNSFYYNQVLHDILNYSNPNTATLNTIVSKYLDNTVDINMIENLSLVEYIPYSLIKCYINNKIQTLNLIEYENCAYQSSPHLYYFGGLIMIFVILALITIGIIILDWSHASDLINDFKTYFKLSFGAIKDMIYLPGKLLVILLKSSLLILVLIMLIVIYIFCYVAVEHNLKPYVKLDVGYDKCKIYAEHNNVFKIDNYYYSTSYRLGYDENLPSDSKTLFTIAVLSYKKLNNWRLLYHIDEIDGIDYILFNGKFNKVYIKEGKIQQLLE